VYLNCIDEVEGWLSPTTGYAMGALLRWQSTRNETGDIAEIGIHNGKSFFPLAIAAEPDDRLLAIDCFQQQEFNVDNSGAGDIEAFRSNIKRWAADRKIEIIARDSSEVRKNLAKFKINNLRFISIDGAHTKDMTRNDLEIADLALKSFGICVLDDFLNPWWTGVVSGFFDFCQDNDGLQPVALLPNKLVLTRPSSVESCKAFLRNKMDSLLLKSDMELAGGAVDFYGEFDMSSAPWAKPPGPREGNPEKSPGSGPLSWERIRTLLHKSN